ncbi:hypothetical protein EJB05_55581, partial [Eragrostis curvula]
MGPRLRACTSGSYSLHERPTGELDSGPSLWALELRGIHLYGPNNGPTSLSGRSSLRGPCPHRAAVARTEGVFLAFGASALRRRAPDTGSTRGGRPSLRTPTPRDGRGGEMNLLAPSSSSISCYHGAAPFTADTASARPQRGSLRLAAAGHRSGPTAAPKNASLHSVPAASVDRRRCDCFDLHQRIVPYADSWAWQQSIVKRRKGLVDRDEDCSDTLIALQHSPVYTLGTDSSEEYLHFNVQDAPFEIHRIDRGGEVTYHGPGQLVMYPILNLRYHKMDLHWYLRSLEEVIIRALKSSFSIKASRVNGLTGVWVGERKVAAIGIHVSRWIAYHGLALNVTTDLTPFEMIVPCGIKDRGVGSIKEILQETSDGRVMDDASLMDIAYKSLIEEFAEIFKLSLEFSSDNSNLLHNV